MKRRKQITLIACLVLSLALILTACGGGGSGDSDEDILAGMKEFSLSDGSASIYLDEDWIVEDMGLANLFMAGTEDGSEGVFVFQFPHDSMYAVPSLDDMKTIILESFQITDDEEAEAFDVPAMRNVSMSRGTVMSGGVAGESCMIYGETDYAFYTIGYVGSKISDSEMNAFRVSCSQFSESEAVGGGSTSGEVSDLSDTVRWFNASYAILTEYNGGDYNIFAGFAANEANKQIQIASLESWWGVTDRATADETLDWALNEGHRTGFAEDMAYFEELGMGDAADKKAFVLENFDMTEDEAEMYVSWYEMYEEYGPNAIDAWDYCRALNLTTFYYLAGYYTEEEALDKSLEIAQILQPLYESWDDMVASYLRGYEYWAEESSQERLDIYEDLKTRSDNPYAVDYNTTLEKTW